MQIKTNIRPRSTALGTPLALVEHTHRGARRRGESYSARSGGYAGSARGYAPLSVQVPHFRVR
ncbi:hypothetical protein [Luteimonas sp. e5]